MATVVIKGITKSGEVAYRVFFDGPKNPDGSRNRKTEMHKIKLPARKMSPEELENWINTRGKEKALDYAKDREKEVNNPQYIEPTKSTFKEFAERWMRDYGEKNLAPKTLHRYKQILESRVYPAMGHLKIEQIKPAHLMEFYKNLQESGIRKDKRPGGLSDKTILYHHRVISSILQDAVQWQVITSNPAARVKPPKVQRKQAAVYDEEQVKTLLAALDAEDPKYRLLINLALFTGLRRGEIMGLEWQDVDFDAGTIKVQQTSQYVPKKGVITKSPKNETSARLLSIPSFIVDMLKQHKKEQAKMQLKVGDLWQGSERIFTTWDGRPMHPDTISKWFRNFLEQAAIHKKCGKTIGSATECPHCKKPVKAEDIIKLPPLPFHGLRHTAATMLINQNIPLKNIAGRLGHADIRTTGNIYSHYLQSADKAIADTLENIHQKIKGQA